jgi:hypothetical protein
MIKKAVFENELIIGMQRELQDHDKKEAMLNLDKAGGYLQAAMEIFEETGLTAQADQVLSVLQKIAEDEQDAKGKPHKSKKPLKVHDPHIKGLTPERMVENLKHHGIVFNMTDDDKADTLLDVDLDDDNNLEVIEENPLDKSFEDES